MVGNDCRGSTTDHHISTAPELQRDDWEPRVIVLIRYGLLKSKATGTGSHSERRTPYTNSEATEIRVSSGVMFCKRQRTSVLTRTLVNVSFGSVNKFSLFYSFSRSSFAHPIPICS